MKTDYRLDAIAHGRSGDKGNHANIAILAYTPSGFTWLREYLSAERVAEYFRALGASKVRSEERRVGKECRL